MCMVKNTPGLTMLKKTKTMKFNLLFSILLFTTGSLWANAVKEISQSTKEVVLEITTSSSNTSGHITKIDHSFSNGNSSRLVYVSQLYGKYNTNEVGVWYNGSQWTIFNQNKKKMPIGTKFFVWIKKNNAERAFMHKTSKYNITDNWTTINDSQLNGNPDAILIVTQRFGKYITSPVGVWYYKGKWRIYTETREKMPEGTMFNVYYQTTIRKRSVVLHQVTSKSKHSFNSKHVTYVKFDNKPSQRMAVFATPHWKGTYNPHVTGVWFSQNTWSVFNQNRKEIPTGVYFNTIHAIKGEKYGREESTASSSTSSSARTSSNRKPTERTRRPARSKTATCSGKATLSNNQYRITEGYIESADGEFAKTVRIKSNGTFRISGLKDGSYTLTINSDDPKFGGKGDYYTPVGRKTFRVSNGSCSSSSLNIKLE